jgi:hypothetical protein
VLMADNRTDRPKGLPYTRRRQGRPRAANVRKKGENRLISFKECDSVRHSGDAWNHESVDFGA